MTKEAGNVLKVGPRSGTGANSGLARFKQPLFSRDLQATVVRD